jgi:hypothetical protein
MLVKFCAKLGVLADENGTSLKYSDAGKSASHAFEIGSGKYEIVGIGYRTISIGITTAFTRSQKKSPQKPLRSFCGD